MNSRFIVVAALVAVGAVLVGCRSQEKATRERMDLEEQSRREAEAANKAITEINRKMFARHPTEKPAAAQATKPPKPDDKDPAPAKE